MTEPTPEDPEVIPADKIVVAPTVVPKKIPAMDDIEGQTQELVGALSNALLLMTATSEMPLTIPPAVIGDLATRLVGYGVRQTEHYDPDVPRASTWLTDGIKANSAPIPEPPQHLEADPFVERVATAPEPPAQIEKAARAVRR